MGFFTIFLLFFIFLFSLTIPIFSFDLDPIGGKVKRGVENYKNKKYKQAMTEFEQVEKEGGKSGRTAFNKGTAQYKTGKYQQAAQSFQAAGKSMDKALRTRAKFNLGNTYYKMGQPQKAMQSYLDALQENPGFEPARKNIELMRQQIQQKQQNSQKKQDNQKKQNRSQNSSANHQKNQQQGQNEQSNPKTNSQQQKKEDTAAGKKQKNSLTREQAERILESARRHDGIKRRQNKSPFHSKKSAKFW